MNEPLVSRFLRYALCVIFVMGIVTTLTLPFMLDRYMAVLYDAYYLEQGYRTFIMVFLIAVAIPGIWTVFEMICMLRSIPQGPFVMRNVHALNRIGVIFLALAAAFLGKCLVYITFLTLGCGILFIVLGLFAFTLANLFKQAVIFREENELTI